MRSNEDVDTPHFTVTLERRGGTHGLTLAGELDLAGASRLRDVLARLDRRPIVADVSGLDFIDAAGLSALVLAMGGRRHPGHVTVCGARGVVRRVIEVGGLGALLVGRAG